MTVTIQPGPVQGTVPSIPSKSAAHRLLLCAALADRPTRVICPQSSQDIDATLRCLKGLGASITPREDGYDVVPLDRNEPVPPCVLDCGESGSTLRFLLPVAGALGVDQVYSQLLPADKVEKVEQLLEVKGIGEATLAKLRPYVTVAPAAEEGGDHGADPGGGR